MTNVIRPIHLQLRPTGVSPKTSPCSQKALRSTCDSLPSQIIPHLFVGSQVQTNEETVNRLNISYILSLGLLPLISSSSPLKSPSPLSPSCGLEAVPIDKAPRGARHTPVDLPMRNNSRTFKIRIRQNDQQQTIRGHNNNNKPLNRDENKCSTRSARSVQCKCINIADDSEQSLLSFFDEALQFIDEARRKKHNILIHCLEGISRSPTIAIAYLMRLNSMRYTDAYNMVKQCRPQIDPNIGFIIQLMNYEKSLEIRDLRTNMHINSRPPMGTANNHTEAIDSDSSNKLQYPK